MSEEPATADELRERITFLTICLGSATRAHLAGDNDPDMLHNMERVREEIEALQNQLNAIS